MKKPQPLIEIRTYQFESGLLHLERVEAARLLDEEVVEMHPAAGRLLGVWDDEMEASAFFSLEDFDDL